MNGAKKKEWHAVVRMKPRNVFAMPESVHTENEGEIDVDSLHVGVEDMIDSHNQECLVNWSRPGMEGVSGDVSVIEKALGESIPEPSAIGLADDQEEDDNSDYIDDGYVAPVNSTE